MNYSISFEVETPKGGIWCFQNQISSEASLIKDLKEYGVEIREFADQEDQKKTEKSVSVEEATLALVTALLTEKIARANNN